MELSLRFITKKLGSDLSKSSRGSRRRIRALLHGTLRRSQQIRLAEAGLARRVRRRRRRSEPASRTRPDSCGSTKPNRRRASPLSGFRERIDALHVLNYLLDMFDLMNSWSTHVQQLLLRKESIDNVVQTLSEVTNNPFYYCDASFRTITIRDDQALITSSDIYRYQSASRQAPRRGHRLHDEVGRPRANEQATRRMAVRRQRNLSHSLRVEDGVLPRKRLRPTSSSSRRTRAKSVCDIDVLGGARRQPHNAVRRTSLPSLPASGRHHEQTLKDLLSGKKHLSTARRSTAC